MRNIELVIICVYSPILFYHFLFLFLSMITRRLFIQLLALPYSYNRDENGAMGYGREPVRTQEK